MENGEVGVVKVMYVINVKVFYILILMDCYMLVMDGIIVIKYIRCLDGVGSDVLIIVLIVNVMFSEKDKCLYVGMNDFILKLVGISCLWDCLFYYLFLLMEMFDSIV